MLHSSSAGQCAHIMSPSWPKYTTFWQADDGCTQGKHDRESRSMHIICTCVCVCVSVCVSYDEIKRKENIPAACGFLPDGVPVVLGMIQGSATENIIKINMVSIMQNKKI